ncbi:MAG TPA: hypothetical protein VJZ76_21170, partial [Thermoanaerobaculia bacterium]|nr:hypothetical protein [Thermoanaerobaculia bacterium]
MKLSEVWPELEQVAAEEGVARLGASALLDEHAALFDEWIAEGHHATMSYLAKSVRGNPAARFPWARSIVVILVPYSPTRPPAPPDALS